jgi:uncharacterized membrane protein YphA (DoxX/SURF4 family)
VPSCLQRRSRNPLSDETTPGNDVLCAGGVRDQLIARLEEQDRGATRLVLDILRVYLGAGLFFRGLALLLTDGGLRQLVGGTAPEVSFSGIVVYVTAAHLVGGALITVGLYTRLAALAQLPVLAGAVFLVH